ncbi:MAG: S1 RNA-binding domain-containing protein, partial [Firmicutes bacterium]|nr:S1 RNA-binding domain-containing protein [Bacillota bacterium]
MEINIPKVGDILTGTVVRVTQEEVLVDVGYMFEGTIYKNHLTSKKIADANELFKIGDEIKAKVTKISHGDNNNILLLSRLDLEKIAIRDKYKDELLINSNVLAKVKRLNPGGIELDYHSIELFLPNSLIDISELNAEQKQALVGQDLLVKIIEIRKERGKDKFIVNRKQLLFDDLKAQEKTELKALVVGEVVKGIVSNITDFGAFVKLSDHLEGLIHISELSQYHIKHVTDVLSIGDEVTAKLIKISGKRVSLSMKALQENPWNVFLEKYKVGDKVTGTVVKKMQFGMLLEIEREISGLLNRFDYSWDPQDNLAGKVEVGSLIEVEITSINPAKQQFTLSKKHLQYNPWADLKLKVGELVSATVKSFVEKGAIVEIAEVEGFLPIGEIQDDRVNRMEDVLKIGDVLTVEVLSFFAKEWKLVVSLKRVQEKKNRKEYETQLKENVSS